jgi:hypothetical protein
MLQGDVQELDGVCGGADEVPDFFHGLTSLNPIPPNYSQVSMEKQKNAEASPCRPLGGRKRVDKFTP